MATIEAPKVEAALSTVIGMFESGDLPAAVGQTVIRNLTTDAPCNNWSLGNQLLTLLVGQTHDARGFKQWQNAGRTVRKGSRAFYILGPKMRTITETNEHGVEEKKRIVTGFVGIPVFRFEDTDGDTIEADHRPLVLPPLMGVAETLGIRVDYAEATDLAMFRGYYAPSDTGERIVLLTHDQRTFFHELGHAVHKRVLEIAGRELKPGQDAAQEIVAETVAATLCHLYGLDGYLWHGAQYIERYAEGENAGRACMKVLADVKACLDLIFKLDDTESGET